MFFDKKKEQKKVEAKILENQKVYRRVLDNVDGLEIMKDLEKRCFVNHTTLSDDAMQMAFNEGRRSVYVYIKNLLEKDFTDLIKEIME